MSDELDRERRRITELVASLANVLDHIHSGATATGTALLAIEAGQAALNQAKTEVRNQAVTYGQALDNALMKSPDAIADAVGSRISASVQKAIKDEVEQMTSATTAAGNAAIALRKAIDTQLGKVVWWAAGAAVVAGAIAGALTAYLLK